VSDTQNHIENARKVGRLIVAGIGKSGHVARKIAATLASTGTPSYFVHPGEASHGDMGMITQQDIVLMLSNSGENAELSDLIHYTRRYNMTLISLTSNPESTLAKQSDIQLIYPKVAEACPNGLAPTTSTTQMIAYGDALAVALLKRMGLTPDQYKVFHPGDLKRNMNAELLTKKVSDIMTPEPKTITSDILAVKALDIMTQKQGHYLTSLVVVDDGKLVGLIRLQDCLQAGLA